MYKLGKKFNDGGVWKDFNGCKLCIAQAGNKKFVNTLEKLKRPFRKQIDRGSFPDTKLQELIIKAASQDILLDWKDVVDDKGSQISYSPEIGFEQLCNDVEMLEFVLDVAGDNEQYRIDDKAKISKK